MKKIGLYVSALLFLFYNLFTYFISFFVNFGYYLSEFNISTALYLLVVFISFPAYIISFVFLIVDRKKPAVSFRASLFLFISSGVYLLYSVVNGIMLYKEYPSRYYIYDIVYGYAYILAAFVFSLIVFIGASKSRKESNNISDPKAFSFVTMQRLSKSLMLIMPIYSLVDLACELSFFYSFNFQTYDYEYMHFSMPIFILTATGFLLTLIFSIIASSIIKKNEASKTSNKKPIALVMIAGFLIVGSVAAAWFISNFYYLINASVYAGVAGLISIILSIILLAKYKKYSLSNNAVEEEDIDYNDEDDYFDDEE